MVRAPHARQSAPAAALLRAQAAGTLPGAGADERAALGGDRLMATAVAEPVTQRPRTRVPLPAKLRKPGWYRAAMFEVLGLGFAIGVDVAVRWAQNIHPLVSGNAIVPLAL